MKTNWKLIGGLAVVLVILFFIPSLFQSLFGYGSGMMGRYGSWNHGMMGGYGFSPFGGAWMSFGMLLAWLFPVGLLFVAGYGVVSLFQQRKPTAVSAPAPSQRTCAHCGEAAEIEWKTCPYCGEEL